VAGRVLPDHTGRLSARPPRVRPIRRGLASASVSAAVESARREWADARRELDATAHDPGRYRALLEQVDVVTAELRRRVGQTFTLAQLADEYAGAERWSRQALSEAEAPAWWPRSLTLVEGAAFHDYARGALDYEP
jgi:hypothetical protein